MLKMNPLRCFKLKEKKRCEHSSDKGMGRKNKKLVSLLTIVYCLDDVIEKGCQQSGKSHPITALAQKKFINLRIVGDEINPSTKFMLR